MGHGDLSVIGVCVVTTPIPEVLTYFPLATPFTTSLGVTPRFDVNEASRSRARGCTGGPMNVWMALVGRRAASSGSAGAPGTPVGNERVSRLKGQNDLRDAGNLADLLWMGRVARVPDRAASDRCPVSDRCWRHPLHWPGPTVLLGRADPHVTVSPTSLCTAGTSPNRAPTWSAERQSRGCSVPRPRPRSQPRTAVSKLAAETSPRLPWQANCSPGMA